MYINSLIRECLQSIQVIGGQLQKVEMSLSMTKDIQFTNTSIKSGDKITTSIGPIYIVDDFEINTEDEHAKVIRFTYNDVKQNKLKYTIASINDDLDVSYITGY